MTIIIFCNKHVQKHLGEGHRVQASLSKSISRAVDSHKHRALYVDENTKLILYVPCNKNVFWINRFSFIIHWGNFFKVIINTLWCIKAAQLPTVKSKELIQMTRVLKQKSTWWFLWLSNDTSKSYRLVQLYSTLLGI